jgi:hypothetical protein
MVRGRIEVDYEKCDEESAKAAVWACNKQFIFRYTNPEKQANAVQTIKAEQAAKKAAAKAQQQSELEKTA